MGISDRLLGRHAILDLFAKSHHVSLFAGEHGPVITALPSGEEQSISFETAGKQVLISRMSRKI